MRVEKRPHSFIDVRKSIPEMAVPGKFDVLDFMAAAFVDVAGSARVVDFHERVGVAIYGEDRVLVREFRFAHANETDGSAHRGNRGDLVRTLRGNQVRKVRS